MLETIVITTQGFLGALTWLAGLLVGMYLFDANLQKRLHFSEDFEKNAAFGTLALILLACLFDQSTNPILGFEVCLTAGGFFGLFMMFMNRPITQLRN